MLHPLPLPLSSCLGCIPPLIGLPSLRFYAVGSSLFLLSVCFCLCSLFYRDDVLCWLLLARPFLYAFHAHLRFPVDLVWFRLSCDHGWIRSGSVNVRKQQQQQIVTETHILTTAYSYVTTEEIDSLFFCCTGRREGGREGGRSHVQKVKATFTSGSGAKGHKSAEHHLKHDLNSPLLSTFDPP